MIACERCGLIYSELQLFHCARCNRLCCLSCLHWHTPNDREDEQGEWLCIECSHKAAPGRYEIDEAHGGWHTV